MDKTVIITGATSGIGKATAKLFATKNYHLILTGRRTERLESLKEDLVQEAASVGIFTFDVRDYQACQDFAKTLKDDNTKVDILINNAGLASGFGPFQDGDIDDWNRMIDTNVKGLAQMSKVIVQLMLPHGFGQIINVCSTAGHEVYPNGNMYCASKHAVDALTHSMRLDLYKHGIKVGQVSPGHVEETEFARVRFHGDQERARIYDDFNPLKSSDVAATILFMAEQPDHVNIQDVLMMGSQQAGSNFIDRSGRKFD